MPRIDTYSDPQLAAWPKKGTVVVFDLEYTSWPGSMERNWSQLCEQREIVQIGAVRAKIADPGFTHLETFDRLVFPLANPHLSCQFIELTGITQEQLQKEGVPFVEAWDAFRSFCRDVFQLWCVGRDAEVLRENFILRNIPGVLPAPCFDIRPALAKALDLNEVEVISSRLPELVQLEPGRHAHQALDDAQSVLNALDHLARQGKLV